MHKVMLITGGSRGIGAATARLAAQHGYDVALSFHQNQAAAAAVVRDVEAQERKALAIQADMAQEKDIRALFQAVDAHFGRLDVLVNNAGIVALRQTVATMPAARIRHIFEVNSVAPFLCAQEAIARMSTQKGNTGGAIINISSAAARLGSAHQYVDYAASKGALNTFTRGLAKEVISEGIRVNAVSAGFIDTDIHEDKAARLQQVSQHIPLGRVGQAHEIAEAVLWLASDKAAYCVGTILDVTGGR